MASLSAKFQNNMITRPGFTVLLVTCLISGDHAVLLGDGVDFSFAKIHHTYPIYHKTSCVTSNHTIFCVSIVKGYGSLSASYKQILSKNDGLVIVNTRKSKTNVALSLKIGHVIKNAIKLVIINVLIWNFADALAIYWTWCGQNLKMINL